jgi:hypothetical protein
MLDKVVAHMYLNILRVVEEAMVEGEPMVVEEDIQDFDKDLEAYKYLIYENHLNYIHF